MSKSEIQRPAEENEETNNDADPEIEIIGEPEHPATSSVKLHGPPGTGKTTQTMERLKELVAEEGFSVGDICFVTYRREMAERFLQKLNEEELISYEARTKPWEHRTRFVGTLHAVCNRLTDLDNPSEGNRSLGGIMHEFCMNEYGVPYYSAEEDSSTSTPGELMFSARSYCIENQIPFDKWHRAPQYSQIQEVWEFYPELTEFENKWNAEKKDREISDFEDMLTSVRDQGITPPRKILAVDEFHDFTPLQIAIVTHWMEQAEIVIVNGDPLQVLYSYKGADPSFFTDLDLPEVLLPQSYRVPRNVWDYAGRTLRPEHEPPAIEPKTPEIDPDGYEGEVREALSVPLGGDKQRSDGRTPAEFVDRYGYDILFLSRTQAQQRDVGRSLKEAGIIFASQEGGGGWNHASKRRSIYNVLAALDGVRKPVEFNGQQSLFGFDERTNDREDTAGSPPSKVWAYGDEISRFLDRVPAEYLRGKSKDKLLTVIKNMGRCTFDEISEYLEPEFWERFTSGPESVEFLLSYDDAALVANALRRYDSEIKRGTFDTRIQTIHAAKGGEADTVVLYDGIPPRVAAEIERNEIEAENEARVWYVGCTRASNRLVVARGGWDWVRSYLPETEHQTAALSEARYR